MGAKRNVQLSLPHGGRALEACVEAALRTGGRPLSITDYATETGISARMLIHYFGSKVNLDRAVIWAVDQRLRAQAGSLAQALGGLGAVDELVRGFKSPASAPVRRLFRTLLAKAFEADSFAVSVLIEERRRWTDLFAGALKNRAAASRAVALLLGAAMDAILDDMSQEGDKRTPVSRRGRGLDSGLLGRRTQQKMPSTGLAPSTGRTPRR